MGLECIGFNRTLYDTLLWRRSGINAKPEMLDWKHEGFY
jgi:hypothetical protein